MKITIVSVGNIKEKYFKDAILEYSKKSNVDAAKKLYTNIYNAYDLGN